MKVMKSGDDTTLSLKQGIDAVADIIKKTIGPNGTNVGVTRKVLPPLITNDGKIILDNIELPDEIQQFAVDKLKSVARTLNDEAGGGRKRAIVLAQAIYNEVYKKYLDPLNFAKENRPAMEIRRELKEACKEAVEALGKKVVTISTLEELEQVAFIASEDKEIASKVAKLVHELGKDADIAVEDGDSFEIETNITKGLEFKNGIVSPYMVTNENLEASVENPRILVTNRRFQSTQELRPLIAKMANNRERQLVIIGDFDTPVVGEFIYNRLNTGFMVTAIKAPMLEALKDICALTGAVLYDKDLTMDLDLDVLGSADKVVSTQEKTLIMGGKGGSAIDARVKELEAKIKDTGSAYDKKNLKERIAKLTTGIGLIKVGAQTQEARDYLKPKVKDTVEATIAALQEGVVAGGGVALHEVSNEVSNILSPAIRAPFQIIKDSGVSSVEADVKDAFKIERMALEVATEITGLLITTKDVISDKNDDEDEE